MRTRDSSRSRNARDAKRLVAGVVFWLLVFELLTRVLWQPAVIGLDLSSRIDASFGYGYDATSSLCSPSGDLMICAPTQYRRFGRQTFSRDKDETTLRFFTVGGSHSAAPGAYPSFAAQALRRECPKIFWEGINLSVRGHGSRRTLLLAKQALLLDPDFLVVDFGGTNEFEDERDLEQYRRLHRGIWRVLLKSHLVALGRKLLTRRFSREFSSLETTQEEAQANSDPVNQIRWNESLNRNYRTLLHLAGDAGVPVVLVGRAVPDGSRNSHWMAREELFRSLPVEPGNRLDTNALFDAAESEAGGRSELFAMDLNHYSEDGQRRIGEQLAQIILNHPSILEQRTCR